MNVSINLVNTMIQITCVIFTYQVLLSMQTYLRKVNTYFHKYDCSRLCKRLVQNLGKHRYKGV